MMEVTPSKGQVRSTPPWAQRASRWPFGGVFVRRTGIPHRSSFEGAG